MRTVSFSAAILMVCTSALAQTSPPARPEQVTVPSAQNSGAGIAGQPGGKSGVSSKSAGPEDSTNAQDDSFARQQDAAKIPGKAGTESGPSPRNGSVSK